MGCDPIKAGPMLPYQHFNPRTRMGCDKRKYKTVYGNTQFQSTHPHGVRPSARGSPLDRPAISIHAPAWGATGVSLHLGLVHDDFNPRTRMGCDSFRSHFTSRYSGFQSTHPHGVRLLGKLIQMTLQKFQSTHPHGVRRHSRLAVLWTGRFQSTHPHGVRQASRVNSVINGAFQSTHPHGVRLGGLSNFCSFFEISIHAPAWGATAIFSSLSVSPNISIHAPAWGATSHCSALRLANVLFQSTHPHGVRHGIRLETGRSVGYFNPRTRMGCDKNGWSDFVAAVKFQSTHPHGVRLDINLNC